MKQAVLSIYYVDKAGKRHHEPQGKFYYHQGKPIYIADVTPNKWWRNYGGYSISRQILDAFSKVKIRPAIIYRDKIKAMVYTSNMTNFKKKGILVAYGGHSQYVLPINRWDAKNILIKGEPYNLPVITVANWIKTKKPDPNEPPAPEDYDFIGNTAVLRKKENMEQGNLGI